MNTYEVRMYERIVHTVEVQAEDPTTAYKFANHIVVNGTEEYDTESQGISSYDVEEIK